MALTDYDKKNLSKEQQAKVQAATDKWNAANAKGDTAGMQAAAAEAAAVRNSAGYKTDSSGNYTGSISSSNKTGGGSSSSNKNSQWTQGNYTIGSDDGKKQAQGMAIDSSWIASDGSEWVKEKDGTITVYHNGTKTTGAYTPTDLGILGKQQMAAGLPYSYVKNTMDSRVAKALGTEGLEGHAYDETYNMMWNYIQDQMRSENQQNYQEQYQNWLDDYEEKKPDDYNSKYQKQIDAMLTEILNRDDFSYDVNKDPLYQQYVQMYQREGDRAMRETMAEAAAGAGGMNTYAITAAQQAQNYYGSQLNDKIPELYQLAYEMYLNDKESKVQDLGILQGMDESQYARYRDTMNDFYNDRSFAYGAYQDAVEQGNWQTQFDYNSMVNDRDFQYNDAWANKQWNAQEEQREIENTRYDNQVALDKERYEKEAAKEEAWTLIGLGVVPTDEVLARAGISWEDADWAAGLVRAEKKLNDATNWSARRNGDGMTAGSEGNPYYESGPYAYDNVTSNSNGNSDGSHIDWSSASGKGNYEFTPNMGGGRAYNALGDSYPYYETPPSDYKQTPPSTPIYTGGGSSANKGGGGSTTKNGGGGGSKSPTTYAPAQEGSGNYNSVRAMAFDIVSTQGTQAGLDFLKEARAVGTIDQSSYMKMYNEIRN